MSKREMINGRLIRILVGLLLWPHCVKAQIAFYNSQLYNSTISPGETFTQIYALFPPQAMGPNNTDFSTYVMTQSAIDGVTLQVPWNAVETVDPTTTPCTGAPDVCQPDPNAPGYFHTYNWGTVNGSGCTDHAASSISQWFCFGKKVGLILFGIADSPSNGVTPKYIWSSGWINSTATAANPTSPYLFQDVVNTINTSPSCGGYSGATGSSFQVPSGTLFQGDSSNPTHVTVSWPAHPFQGGETIWLNPQFLLSHPNFDVTTPHGATVMTAIPGTSFTYVSTVGPDNGSANSTANTQIITADQSWPVPYEAPYKAGWLAFLRAAIYHFNNLNVAITGGQEDLSHIAYIRPGVARGGEAIPLCSTGAGANWSPTYSQGNWENWYGTVNDTVQAASPQMQVLYSLNAGDPQHKDASYTTDQAARAVAHANGAGQFNGFGSQGLQNSDRTNWNGPGTGLQVPNCPSGTNPPVPDTGNNWGCMFLKYWSDANNTEYNTPNDTPSPTTVPLELQQIDCSNPCVDGTCTDQGSNSDSCFLSSLAPGKTQDLRLVYPFATQHHVSVLELYSQDALLAFDPFYCTLSGISCSSSGVTFTKLTAPTQNEFFQDVGIGDKNNCYLNYNGGTNQSGAHGDCSYAAAMYAAHGYH